MTDFLSTDAAVRQLVDGMSDHAIFVLDPAGQVASWNLGATIMKGYSATDIVGRNFEVFYTPQARALGHPQRELSAAASLGRFEERGWRVRKDGRQFWAYVVIVPIFDADHTLCGYGKTVRDVTDDKQGVEQSANVMKLLEFTARSDYLTGLDNRRSLDTELARVYSAVRRDSRALCLAMLDLDYFKAFNDGFGHQAGDAYLKKTAGIWRRALRPEDFAARYGGEEFIVLLPDIDATGGIDAMDRLRRITPPPNTCSIGLAEWDGSETVDQLLGRADRALYQAKATGRNRVVCAPMAVASRTQIAQSTTAGGCRPDRRARGRPIGSPGHPPAETAESPAAAVAADIRSGGRPNAAPPAGR